MKKYIILALAWMFVILSVYRPSYINVKTPVHAWWGSMYPEYCFSESEEGDLPIKIGFRWLPIR